jgi:hypothetical protein
MRSSVTTQWQNTSLLDINPTSPNFRVEVEFESVFVA